MSPKSRKLLAPALSLSFLAVAFSFGEGGVIWFWTRQPAVAVVLAAGAAVAWALLLLSLRESRPPST
ncbi:MAG: hypothetical protein OJF55_001139 [Rhodanobacteraceae bacterium]|jgi:hypothetical protein|nr:MAG: hypothetical protein OJF55_001139 [Rhodanobacteraceae bacterium]